MGLDGALDTHGRLLWQNVDPGLPAYLGAVTARTGTGDIPSVADLDDDPFPELITTWGASRPATTTCLEHDGSVKWEVPFDSRGSDAPAVCDLDGDGTAEMIMEYSDLGSANLTAVRADGSVMWEVPHSMGNRVPSPTCFDFNGDGFPELVHFTETELQIRSGITGFLLSSTEWASPGTPIHRPIIADVDNDGSAEIVAPKNVTGPAPGQQSGLLAYGNPSWKDARPRPRRRPNRLVKERRWSWMRHPPRSPIAPAAPSTGSR